MRKHAVKIPQPVNHLLKTICDAKPAKLSVEIKNAPLLAKSKLVGKKWKGEGKNQTREPGKARRGYFGIKSKLQGARVIGSHPPKFGSKRFSDGRVWTCGQTDG